MARIACLGIDANTDQQIQWIKTKLAQRIMEYAEEGERDVAHLKEFGLQGLPHLCAHRIELPRRTSFTGRPHAFSPRLAAKGLKADLSGALARRPLLTQSGLSPLCQGNQLQIFNFSETRA